MGLPALVGKVTFCSGQQQLQRPTTVQVLRISTRWMLSNKWGICIITPQWLWNNHKKAGKNVRAGRTGLRCGMLTTRHCMAVGLLNLQVLCKTCITVGLSTSCQGVGGSSWGPLPLWEFIYWWCLMGEIFPSIVQSLVRCPCKQTLLIFLE